MVQLGPEYNLAVRLKNLEDAVARLRANPLGQGFSTSQSDGSVGLEIGTDQTTGAARLVFRQGTTTSRDPNTDQHPALLYIGEGVSGGQFVDSLVIFYRPTGTESAVVGNRGVQVYDTQGHQVFGTDEYGTSPSGIGLNNPWIPLGQPVTNNVNGTGWPQTTSTSLATVSLLQFPAQHSHITWYGTTYLASGTGKIQVSVNNGSAGATHSVGSGFTNLNETFSLGTWSWQQTLELSGSAAVTSGAGPIYFLITGVWGCGSGF